MVTSAKEDSFGDGLGNVSVPQWEATNGGHVLENAEVG